MTKLPIIQLGNPILRQKAEKVDFHQLKTKEYKQLLKDMKETLLAADGMGLAAPQVSQSVRIIALTIPPEVMGHKMAGFPLQTLINPQIKSASKETVADWEGCLSFDFLRGQVPRAKSVVVDAWDENGENITVEAFDLLARVLQHEIDHLDGILYLERMTDITTLMSTVEYKKIFDEEPVAV